MKKNDTITIYTDGACSGNPGPGGWGTVILADGSEKRLSGGEKETTNNRMELTAAIQGLSAVLSNAEWKACPVVIYTDSQYVKNGITTWIVSWRQNNWRSSAKNPVKNKDLWQVLDALNSALSVTWQWVRGHHGNEYNEICDDLARKESEKFHLGA
jgi:ribonuclease HI